MFTEMDHFLGNAIMVYLKYDYILDGMYAN